MKEWYDVSFGHSLKVVIQFYKYFDNKKAIGDKKCVYNPVK